MMKRKIMVGECSHKWKIIRIIDGEEKGIFKRYKVKIFILQCSKCGDIKQRWTDSPLNSKESIEKSERRIK